LVVSVNLSELDYAVLQQWRWAGRGGMFKYGGVLEKKIGGDDEEEEEPYLH
jgi:hypothetical protein